MQKKTSFTYKLDDSRQILLTELLRHGNYRPVEVPYAIVACETNECRVVLYKSGKCLVQGKGAEEFVSFVLEPLILQRAEIGYEQILNPQAFEPHMGVDESGKGDFFGPMVTAAVYVDRDLAGKMQEMDVKDSKRITSDTKALHLGRDIRGLLGKRYSIVRIGPEAYNRLYLKMRNVNKLLAWAHARAIENLLDTVPGCPRAISDQFGNKAQVENALMKNGRGITLEQKHRAESDIAVAAASIIAREEFLRSLKKMEKEYDVRIPKGASETVRQAAVELVEKLGPEILLKTAKCHFKTTDAVLSEAGRDRSALGPEGQAVSKPPQKRKSSKKD